MDLFQIKLYFKIFHHNKLELKSFNSYIFGHAIGCFSDFWNDSSFMINICCKIFLVDFIPSMGIV